jgi:hypothetical protein
MTDQPQTLDTETAHDAYQPYYSRERRIIQFEITDAVISDYHDSHVMQPMVDFFMNWLPPDNSIPIDYNRIVGMGINFMDLASFAIRTNRHLKFARFDAALLDGRNLSGECRG